MKEVLQIILTARSAFSSHSSSLAKILPLWAKAKNTSEW
jgi:hypothetical protein